MITLKKIRAVETTLNGLHRRIDEAYRERNQRKDGMEQWGNACAAFRSFDHEVFQLWDRHILAKVERAPGRWREAAILFLEADPWFFRSGYLKVELIRSLKRATLTPREIERLGFVLIQTVDRRHRREFRSYCRLAAHVATPELAERLRERLDSQDAEVRRRARWMLSRVEQRAKQSTQLSDDTLG